MTSLTKKANMKKILLLFLVTTTLTCSFQHEYNEATTEVESDPEMEKYLKEALENFREQMKEGIAAINMPRLDPLDLRNLDVDVNENLAKLSLRIKQVSVSGLSLFNITDLKSSLEHLFLHVNLTLPEINVQGMYSVDGKFLSIFPLYGSGRFEINATEINIAGRGELVFSNHTLQMTLLKMDLIWQHMTVFLENFLKGGDFSAVLQRIIPGVGRDVFIAYKPLILDKLENCLTDEINERLNDPLVKDILKNINFEEY